MMNAKQRRWWIGTVFCLTAASSACTDDEIPDPGSEALTDDEGNDSAGEGHEQPDCGNGTLDPGEACDDGNTANDDACTNACMLPACGDGIVQPEAGEVCDDGNSVPGDGCTVNCKLRGAKLAEHTSEWFSLGTSVVVDSNDHIVVLGSANGEYWVAKFDDNFETMWDGASLPGKPPELAIGANDELLVGGYLGDHARASRLDGNDGAQVWVEGLAHVQSTFASVAIAGEHMISAGYFGPMFHEQGLLVRHDRGTGIPVATLEWPDGPFGPMAINDSGWVWVIENDKEAELHVYGPTNELESKRGLASGVYEDILIDEQRNVYALSHSMAKQSFMLAKWREDGTPAWQAHKYVDASANAMVFAPGGLVIVAGHTSDESSGLLVWIDAESGELVDELVIGIDGDAGQYEVFHDIAVAPSGNFAVAVGGRGLAGDNTALWIYQVAL